MQIAKCKMQNEEKNLSDWLRKEMNYCNGLNNEKGPVCQGLVDKILGAKCSVASQVIKYFRQIGNNCREWIYLVVKFAICNLHFALINNREVRVYEPKNTNVIL
jgi:hypothetical protein